jgi:drug/metabolite transporter (DMT)-like permease
MPSAKPDSAVFDRAAPIFFVLLWSTGWIVARYAAEYADPLTFLCFRYGAAACIRYVGASISPSKRLSRAAILIACGAISKRSTDARAWPSRAACPAPIAI